MGIFQSLKERLQKANEPQAPAGAPEAPAQGPSPAPAADGTAAPQSAEAAPPEDTAPPADELTPPEEPQAPPADTAPAPAAAPAPPVESAHVTASPLAFLGEKYPAAVEAQRSAYSDLLTQLQANCSRLRADGAYAAPLGDETIALCEQAISLRKELLPSLAEYDWVRHNNDPYKRLAVVYEKRGDYQQAAAVSLRALQDGLPNDGNAKGFAGRLDRMLKRGQLQPTDEMKQYLSKSRA